MRLDAGLLLLGARLVRLDTGLVIIGAGLVLLETVLPMAGFWMKTSLMGHQRSVAGVAGSSPGSSRPLLQVPWVSQVTRRAFPSKAMLRE